MVCVCADFIKITCRVCWNSATETEKNKIKIVHVFVSAFGFCAYVKALIGFKAFYFSVRFGSVSVRFRCVCEMALRVRELICFYSFQSLNFYDEDLICQRQHDRIYNPFDSVGDLRSNTHITPSQLPCCSKATLQTAMFWVNQDNTAGMSYATQCVSKTRSSQVWPQGPVEFGEI